MTIFLGETGYPDIIDEGDNVATDRAPSLVSEVVPLHHFGEEWVVFRHAW